eukprot:TRINITY_DN4829_c1_g1_i1.p1 TRINITY_DN4829_c1_g1~~TRINITY_DN4829_c1_g1_i1.p1  ORF type:complete len:405 (-),score=137.76 TRINITY_DN4829_c1_g1_i1:283-1497(-)
MGCTSSKQAPVQNDRNTLRLLLLGIGGCGKSTFVRQMRIIHTIGWNEVELDNFRSIIRKNIFFATRTTLLKAEELNIKVNADKEVLDAFGPSVKPQDVKYDSSFAETAKTLWKNESFLNVWTQHKNTIFLGQLEYFVDKIDVLCSNDYVPDDEDILKCRQRTIGANTNIIYTEKHYWEFLDVGGQKPERDKWEKIMETTSLHCIIFIVAADEYDIVDPGVDEKKTKVDVSREIFEDLIKKLGDTTSLTLLVFFNKTDLLKNALGNKKRLKSFKKIYPTFKLHDGDEGDDVDEEDDKKKKKKKKKKGDDESGDDDDEESGDDESGDGGDDDDDDEKKKKKNEVSNEVLNSALQTMSNEFLKNISNKDDIRVHYTCGLDTNSMKLVWTDIRGNIFKQRLARSGFAT